jgi:uncharacterized membrane protein YfcA
MVVGALIGAALNTAVEADPLLLIVGIALVILPLLSISEKWTDYRLPEAEDRIGGFGSGFFGGLTGLEGWQILDAGWLIVGLVLAAVLGVQLGKRWLKKWKSDTIRNGILVAIVASGVLYIREAAVALGWL